MGQPKKRPECVLGFYQTVGQPNGDVSGGILVTSHMGRPIEFQCSLPVRPNATQQTLYGATLRPFLIGELIAGALRDKLDLKPDVLFVDDPQTLNQETWGDVLICCFRNPEANVVKRKFRTDEFWIAAASQEKADQTLKLLEKHVPEGADLKEPLLRVEQALKEAMGQAA